MHILIFSDSHGNANNMRALLKKCIPQTDAVLFLGDGAREFSVLAKEYSGQADFFAVRGNCDGEIELPDERVLSFDGIKILMTHGHKYGVKNSTVRLEYRARELECDLVLYGHTHSRETRYLPEPKPLHILCPGSISRPAFGRASFGTADIKNGQLLTGCAEINGDLIK